MLVAVKVECAWCGAAFKKLTGDHNRSVKEGWAEYCGRGCSGLARRTPEHLRLTAAESVVAKAAYDREYRARNHEAIRQKKAAHYAANSAAIYKQQRDRRLNDPDVMRRYRESQRRCQEGPGWKEHKRKYDREFRAKKEYGEFWESQVALMEIKDESARLGSMHERRLERGETNKKQDRRREWERNQPEKP